MEKLNLILSCLILAIVITGCSNAITYYHAERASIALEARTTDPQQPLQGNVGIKTRTVIVVPGKNGSNTATRPGDKKTSELGEAASVISDFKLDRNESGVFGKTDINSSFITGAAAVAAPPESAKALSGLGFDPIGDTSVYNFQLMSTIYDKLKDQKSKDDESARYVALLDELGKLLPDDIPSRTYYAIKGNNITEKKPVPTITKDFIGVLEYEALVRGSLVKLEQIEKHRNITYNSNPIDETQMKKLSVKKEFLKNERAHFFATIGNSNIIDAAAAYVISHL